MADSPLDTRKLRLITFDCYGTLIDWEAGIRKVLDRQLKSGGVEWDDSYFDLYVQHEAQQECQSYRPYREILAAAEAEVLAEAGLPATRKPQLADSIGSWPPFPDTVESLARLRHRYALGILSNIDRDLFRKTNPLLKIAFDVVVTADDVRYYKPGPAHFARLRELTGVGDGEHLHAAQSLYHDIVPCHELNIPCVWINRRNQKNTGSARPLAEFPDLASFADAVL